MSEPERPIEELGFEEAMQSLDTLVSDLESGQLPLEEMVGAYERGMSLLRVCRARIDTARRRVEAINLNLEGKPQATLTEFAALEISDTSTSSVAAPKRASSPAKSRERAKDTDTGEKSDTGEIRLF